jgi:hypothetical protein
MRVIENIRREVARLAFFAMTSDAIDSALCFFLRFDRYPSNMATPGGGRTFKCARHLQVSLVTTTPGGAA